MAKKYPTPGAKRRARKLQRRAFIKGGGIALGGAAAATVPTGILGFLWRGRRRRAQAMVAAIDSEQASLRSSNFGQGPHEREWAHISNLFTQHLTEAERPRRLEYLQAIDRLLQSTWGITPINVVHTIRVTPPSAVQANLVRQKLAYNKKRLEEARRQEKREPTKPWIKKERERLEGEVRRLNNVITICEEAEKLGGLRNELNDIINRIHTDNIREIERLRDEGML